MRKIRAAVCRAFDAPLSIETLHLRPPRAGEVEVAVEAVAVCHSDIHFAEGAWAGDLPAVYGHEAAGRVTAAGPGVQGIAPGDRVIVTLLRACGACPTCAGGQPAYCGRPPADSPLSLPDGTAVVQGMDAGAFADHVTVHHSQIAPIGDAIPMTSACLMACGVITGIGGVINAGRLRPGEDVVVIGAGGVGLNAVQGARIAGARRIVAVDLDAAKLEAALDYGATDGVLASDTAPWRAVASRLGRPADLAVVTVGAIPAYETAPRYVGPRGRVVAIGMPHSGAMASYEPVVLAALGQSVIGSKMGDTVLGRDIPWMSDLYAQGRLKLDELVSRTWPLDQINAAFASTKSGVLGRNVIVF